ncbi:MAG TPA: AI-2E family transporter [Acidobacteriaceae bacterium]|jgi:predicted PurR-regulated permease PerM|nr:AI-2E family transporter [Acidobacteriaceae bacterium]
MAKPPFTLRPLSTTFTLFPRDEQRRAVRGHILFFFAMVLAGAVVWRLRSVLEVVYVSALFAVVLTPVVERVMRLRIGRWQPSRTVSVLALVLAVFAGLAVFLVVGLPPVLHDVQHFASDLPKRVPEVVARIKHLPMADRMGVDSLTNKAEGLVATTASYVVASAPKWISRMLDVVTAGILCVYFMLEGEFAYYYFLSFFPIESRDRLARTLLAAEGRMSKWLLGQASLMLILGVSSTIVFGFLHVRYFFLLGVLMGLFNLIPVIGGVITILLAAGVAALDSVSKMAGVFIFYGIYIQIENAYLTPRIMRSSVNLMGLSVLIALLAGSALAGVVGALVAVPTAALVAVLMDEYLVQKDAEAAAAVSKAEASAQ